MTEQLDTLRVAFDDGVSAGAEKARKSLEGLGNEAIVTEERVTRTSRSGAALGRQFGDTERLTAKLEATSKRFQRALDDLEKSELDLADKEKLRANILAQQAAAVDKVHASHQRYLEAMRAAATASNDNAAGLNATAKAAAGAADGTKLAAHQITNLGYQLQDAAVQLAGGQNPLLILMQQGPQATGAVGGVANAMRLLASPTVLAAGAVAALVVPLALGVARAVDLANESRALSVAIKGMGRDAETSTTQLAALVDQLRHAGVAADDARTIAAASIRNPFVSAARGGQFAGMAQDFGAGTAQDAVAAMNRLMDAAASGYAGIMKLNEAYNFLTTSQAREIRLASEQGDGARALDIAVAALERRFKGLASEAMSPAAKAMKETGNAWRDFMDAIAKSETVQTIITKVGDALRYYAESARLAKMQDNPLVRLSDLLDQAADLQDQIGRMKQYPQQFGAGYLGPSVDALETRLAGINKQIDEARQKARGLANPTGGKPGGSAAAGAGGKSPAQIALDDYILSLQREQEALRASLPARERIRIDREWEAKSLELAKDGLDLTAAKTEFYRTRLLALSDAARQESDAIGRSTKAAMDQAAAWQQGATAANEAAARSQALEAQATKYGVSVEALTKRLLDQKAAQAAAEQAKGNNDLAERLVYLNKLVEAEGKGAAAVAEVELAEKQRLATKEAMAALSEKSDPKIVEALKAEIANTKELTRVTDKAERERVALQSLRARQQDLLLAQAERDIALEDDPTKRAAMALTLQHRRDEYEIRQRLAGLGEDAVQKELAMADAVAKTRAEAQRYEEIREKGKQLFDDLSNMLSQAGQSGGKSFAKSLRDYGLSAIETLKRELLFRPIIQPILTGIVGAAPSLFGISGATGTGAATSGGLGSILSPITDILGMAKSFVGDVFGGVSSWINGIGSSLGFASTYATPMATSAALGVAGIPGGVTGTTLGTATNVGGLFGSTTLSGFLGGAGLGFGAGNLLASLLGRSGTGSTVGSGIGSLAGAAIGSIFPGVGTILGGLLGGAGGGLLGSFFGGDEQRPLGNAQLGAVKNGRLTFGQTTSLDGYDNSREIQQMQQAVSLVNGIIDKFGLTLDESLLRRGFEDTSNPIGLIGKTSTFDGPANLQEWIQRFFSGREGQSYLKGATGTLGTAFDRLSSGGYKPETGDDVLKMLDYAAGFDDAVKRAAAGVNTLKRQTLEWEIAARESGKNLAKTVRDYIDQARQYFGEGSTQVNQAATAQRQNIYSMMNLDTAGNAIDPNAPSDMLTGRAADLAQAKAQIAQYKDALIATGLTAEQAAAAVDRGMAATAAAINARWDEIDRRSNAALTQRQGNAAIIAYGAKSGYTSDQLAIDAQAEQQRQELYDAKAAGKSPAEIARIETAQATERAALAEQQLEQARRATESMTDRQNAALVTLGRASEADAQRSSLQARHRQELWDAEHQGRDKDSIKMLLHTQQLEDEALAYQQAVQAAQQAAQAAGAFNASLTSVAVARAQATATAAANQLTDANTALATAEQDLNAARSAATASINEQVSAWTNAANSLKSIREQLLTGNLNPADRYQQMLAAQGLYQDARAKASSDPTAAAALGGYAQQYLQSAMAYLGPNAEYARIFDEVTGTLQGTETVAQQQARTAQSQLTQLQNIAGSTKSVDEAFAAYVAAQAAKDKASAGKATAEAGMNSGLLGQFNTLAGQYSAYMATETPKVGAVDASKNAETTFGGARDAILNAITDWKILNQIGERYYNRVVGGVADVIRVKVLQLGGTPSFEQGGYHWGGLRLVGERGPELEATGPARYWSAADTRAMLAPSAGRFDMPAMPRGAANDCETTAELVAELKALRKEVAELKGEAQAGNRIAIAAAEANVDGLAVTAREQRQTAVAVKRAGVAR